MSERLAYKGGLPGSRRSPCLGCDGRVVTARDPHVLIGGKRDGSVLAVFDAAPQRCWATDPERLFEPGLELLGVAHRTCIDRARRRLEAQQVALPAELPQLLCDEEVADLPPLHLPPPAGCCAFCGAAETSEEHVWPRWVSRELSRYGGFIVSTPYGSRRVPSLEIKAPVCRPCNNRWLSVLEHDVQPLLGPMLHGQERTLAPDEQRLLAAWAVKTALMLDLSGGAPLVPTGFYHDFRLHRRALDSHIVFLAAYLGSRRAVWAQRAGLRIGGIPDTQPPNAFVATFTVFRVVFQVLGHFTVGSATLHGERWPFAPALVQIWPPQDHPVEWPPNRFALGDDALADLANSINIDGQR